MFLQKSKHSYYNYSYHFSKKNFVLHGLKICGFLQAVVVAILTTMLGIVLLFGNATAQHCLVSTLWELCLPLSLCTNLCVVSPLCAPSCLCRTPSVPLSSISVIADRKWLEEPMMSSCVFSPRHLIVALLAVWAGAKCTAGCSDVMVTTPNRQ